MTAFFLPSRVSDLVADQTDATIATGAGGVSGDLIIKTNATERMRVAFGSGNITIPDSSSFTSGRSRVSIPATMANAVAPGSGLQPRPLYVKGTGKGNNGVTGQGMWGIVVDMADASGVVNKTISSWANNGGLFQATTSAAHGFATGDRIVVYGVTGTTTPNASWVITVDSATQFTLQASTFAGGATGGTVTNRPYMGGVLVNANVTLDRNVGMTGALANCDDFALFAVQNTGTGKANECFYIANASNVASGAGYQAALSIGGKVDKGIQFGQPVTTWGIDFWHSSTATYGSGAIRLPNNVGVYARNAADSTDVLVLKLDSANRIIIGDAANAAGVSFANDLSLSAVDITSSGTKIGTLTTHKFGFYGAAPVVQPAGTTDVLASLVTLGLRAASSNPPLDLGTGMVTAGTLDLSAGTVTTGVIRVANNVAYTARNAAGNADIALFKLDTSNRISFQTTMSVVDGADTVLGSSTGSRIGTATTQKLGFFGSTAIVQPAGTTDLRTALINLGLYASGGATPLDLNGGTLTAAVGVFGTTPATTGTINLPNNAAISARNAANSADIAMLKLDTSNRISMQTTVSIVDGVNIVLGTSTGSSIAFTTSQKLAFHGATAVIQRAGAAQAAAATTAATNTLPYGYTTAAQADAIVTLVNEIRATLVEKGLMKGAA